MTVYLSNRDGNGKTNEEGHYRLQTRILKGGVLLADDLKVVQTSPLAMGVYVSPGDYRMELAAGYSYTGWIDANEVVSIATADPANPRITTIVLYVDKGAATSASPPNNPGVAKIMAVNGTAAASPSAPSGSAIQAAVGSGNPYMILADIAVASGATQISNANITDLRTRIGLLDELLSGSNIKTLVGPLMYPVGSIYIQAAVATNPATLLGFGTWVQYGAGRVLVSQDSGQAEFDVLGETGGTKTHRHKGYEEGDGYGNGDLRTAIGAQASDANRLGYVAVGATMPNGQARPNSTYSGTWANPSSNRSDWNHFTPVYGYVSTTPNLPPYIVVYMWQRTA